MLSTKSIVLFTLVVLVIILTNQTTAEEEWPKFTQALKDFFSLNEKFFPLLEEHSKKIKSGREMYDHRIKYFIKSTKSQKKGDNHVMGLTWMQDFDLWENYFKPENLKEPTDPKLLKIKVKIIQMLCKHRDDKPDLWWVSGDGSEEIIERYCNNWCYSSLSDMYK